MKEIIAVVVAMLLTMTSLPLFQQYQKKGLDNTKIAATAQQARQIAEALQLYIKANAAAITTSTLPVGNTLANITITMLQCAAPTAGCPTVPYLSPSIANLNPYGQTWVAEILQPTAGQLQALIFSRGVPTIPPTHLAQIAMLSSSTTGAQGGFVPYANQFGPATDTAAAQGANWALSLANYTQDGPGHLASRFDYNVNTQTNTYLNRNAVPGNPSLNTMNTPLQMGAGTVQISGGACVAADLGKLARDTGGNVLMCNGTNWKTQGSAFWQDPATTFINLPTCNAAAINQTRIVKTPSVGTGPRAYTCNGATWQPLGIDDNGNLTITGTATVGTACSPNGKIAQDGTGLLLSCQSGVWNKQGNGIGTSQVGYGNTIGSCNGKVGLAHFNASNKSRVVMITMVNGLSVNSYAWINGVVVASQYGWGGGLIAPYTLLVPPGASYSVSGGTRCDAWTEWQ